ncbi:YheC/YheD family protein [Paenibacillus montanisoli]|uniref:YheC/YheD family protein n=1 Tax=Paenibacillus montanisoli TaxID=2081970 RepID=A0A328TVB1_9BACL|nr:YheC/YheD family protein [Paenibacillus montanisoli]RAP74280.1 YheC/YheD family protein [Paenibacillus montanisoli]
MRIQRIGSKWAKTKVLQQSEALNELIPITNEWSISVLEQMLGELQMLYVKPDLGTFGKGVFRVEKQADNLYSYQLGTKLNTFPAFEDMARSLQEAIQGRRYLIQQGIPLLTYDSRRFDVRVMVQQNPKRKWETTGIIARLGDPSKIVTNCHSGGKAVSFDKLMRPYMTPSQMSGYKQWLAEIGLATAHQLQATYVGVKEIGLDVAIDESFRPWILEVNTIPDPYIFRKLTDKNIFRRIYRYHKSNNRRVK